MIQKTKNEYDIAKKMLSTMRNLNNRYNQSLYEDVETEEPNINSEKNDVIVVNDVEININSTDENDLELDEEQKKIISQMIDNFKTQVTQIVEFEPGITMNENQIRLDGTLTDDDIEFVLISGDESGLYVNADMLKIEDDTFTILEKLKNFEQTYKTAIDPLLDLRKNNI